MIDAHRSRAVKSRRFRPRRALACEALEPRRPCAADFFNAFFPCDVNNDGALTPLDALLTRNELASGGPRLLPPAALPPGQWFDVDGSGSLEPADLLQIVNRLNEKPASSTAPPLALAAGLTPDSDPDGNGVVLRSDVTLQGQSVPGAAVRLTVDGGTAQWVVSDDNGRFQFALQVGPGAHRVKLEVTDQLRPVVTVEQTVRHGDTVLDWNATLLGVIRDWTTLSNDPYTNRVVTERPPVAARNLAMVHLAMFEAVNAIEGGYTPYLETLDAPADASTLAAAAAAAHRVAVSVYSQPQEVAVFDAALLEALATVPAGPARDAGLAVGQAAGDAILAARAHDGASAVVRYTPGKEPGDWNRTFPDFLPPLLPQWPQVTPFALEQTDMFRPAPPPALDSAEYAAAVDEVRRLGSYAASDRTADQTEIALYWADGGGTFTPPGHWNQIAADVLLTRSTSLLEQARLFALLNTALADAGISCWDTKYTYELWRPIDAIRRGDTDGNPLTEADASWLPLLKTPPFPTYTSGHSTFSGAASAVLAALLGDQVSFSSQADGHFGFRLRPLAAEQLVTRNFSSFSAAAEEAGRSRIYGGIHFEFDNAQGLASGRAIGAYVVAHFLQPLNVGEST